VADDAGVPTPDEGAALVALAVEAIAARLSGRHPRPGVPEFPRLLAIGASFITLERAGRLRGCIGTVQARRPLYLDVLRNARQAMTDPRLPPVTEADWPQLDVKVSVLSTPAPLPARTHAELAGLLRPGIDGIVLADGQRRATFLPSVWGKLPDPVDFLDGLLDKGGWTGWPDEVAAFRYTSVEFVDQAPRPPLG
jgi:AmmeMemoRadiSam system protein A